jgi:hypothetical protein
MNIEDKMFCEAVLKYLCVGGQIEGIRFGAAPQLLISNSEIKGQIYVNLSSRWCVFNSLPLVLPESEDQIKELPEDEELIELCKLRYRTIQNIYLSESKPNLIIDFDDNSIFLMNGYDKSYESWQLGVAYDQHWEVIAMPGGEITAFVPEQYKKHFDR